jgi:hypothetical protein
MNMTPETYFLYVLFASNAILLAISCLAVVRFERRWKRIEQFWDSPTGSALSDSYDDEIRAQVEATKRLEKRLGELQRTVKVMDMKAPQQSPPTERTLPIENAVRMARSGASIEDLTRNCGLNFGEARLMQKLHGKALMTAKPH